MTPPPERSGVALKVPLYVKLMVSYLLVVGLVLLPSVIYLRSLLSRDQHARAVADMTQELTGISDRLGDSSPAQLTARTEALLAALPTRLTVVDAAGNVLGDSARPGVAIENHAGRPEIREALLRRRGHHRATQPHDGAHDALRRDALSANGHGAGRCAALA